MVWTIKKYPDDFKVEEVININPVSHGRYLLLLVKRKNMEHASMLSLISNFFGVPLSFISFGGIKDKKAEIAQYLAIDRHRIKRKKIEAINKGIYLFKKDSGYLFIKGNGYIDETLGSNLLFGNRFFIVIRGVERKDLEILETLDLNSIFIPNYFDSQRFSKSNILIGKKIIKRKFKEACKLIKKQEGINGCNGLECLKKLPKWLIKLYTNSFQSWIWNLTLAKIINLFSDNNLSISILDKEFPIPLSKIPVMELSLPGYGLDDEYNGIIMEILKSYGISLEDFIIRQIPYASLESIKRSTKIDIKNFNIEKFNEKLKNLEVSFFLPPGSYATILIRSLEKIVSHYKNSNLK